MITLYFLLFRLWYRTYALVEAAFVGLWLGVLSPRALRIIDETMYRKSKTYQSEQHNQRGLFDWEAATVESYFSHVHRLLLIGVGGGREMLALSRMGYEVTGYECNRALLDYAAAMLRRAGCTSTVSFLARDAVPDTEIRYDGAIIGWSAYMLIAGSNSRVQFLRQLRRGLKKEAPVLLSFFTRSEDAVRLARIQRTANVIRRMLHRHPVELGDDLAPNLVHRFTEAEIALELRAAGYRLAHYQPEGTGPYDSGCAVGVAMDAGAAVVDR